MDYMQQVTCTNCGTPFGEGQAFCAKCGAAKPVVPVAPPVPVESPAKTFCAKCGTEILSGQGFCPRCGQPAGLQIAPEVNSAINQFNANLQTKKKSKAPLIIGIIAGVAAVVAAVVLLSGPKVESVDITQSSVELRVGDTSSLTYVIEPEKAEDVEVEWSTSDSSVATVSKKGVVEAKGEGTCRITIKAGDKRDTVNVKVVKLYPQEKKAVGTWSPVGYLDDNDNFKILPSYTGDFVVYSDFTGRVTVGSETYKFTWSFAEEGDTVTLYNMKLDNGNKFQFMIGEIDGDESLIFMLDSMNVLYQK